MNSTIYIIDIANASNYDKKDHYDGIVFFSDEWQGRKEQCENFIQSQNKVFERKIYGRKCSIKQISNIDGKLFFDKYHIQGSNHLGIVFFGLFYQNEIIGAMSLGRHHRNVSGNKIILDRFCIASGVHAVGGASKLFKRCLEWAKENKYEEIISFSDNRWTCGNIYEILGFNLEKNHKADYCYVNSNNPIKRISKQSQKKSSSKCPERLTEFEWAETRGLKKLWDKGKKRWAYQLNPDNQSYKEKLSAKCSEQNKRGDFKHSYIRGYFKSNKCQCDIYYSSSYELRCIFLLENDNKIKFYRRAETFTDSDGKGRNPDLYVEYIDGNCQIIEVKPEKRLEEELVKKQIEESIKYTTLKNYSFLIWSEKNSELSNDRAIIRWARKFIAETTGNHDWLENKKKSDRKKSKKHYLNKISLETVDVWCEHCKITHNPLKKTYLKNIERNGKYICESYGGFISGSKQKIKKENPYFLEGKKQCTKCKEIKLFEEFHKDKYKLNGFANCCKKCRSIKN